MTPSECPATALCAAMGLEGTPRCGYLPEHTVPLVFAEQNCLRALQGAHNRALQRTGDHKPSALGRVTQARAWSFLELGMAAEDADEAHVFFQAASNGTDAVLMNETLDSGVRLHAALLKVHLPAFQKRREDAPITAEDIQYIREGLAGTYTFGKALSAAENTNRHRVIQELITTMLAAARAGTIIYPASPRESQTEHFTPPLNSDETVYGSVKHDGYVALDGLHKLPIKMQSSSRTKYSKQVLRMSTTRLVDNTFDVLRRSTIPGNSERYQQLREAGYTPAYLHAAVARLLVTEIQQPGSLGSTEYYFLNGLSDTLQATLTHHQQRMAVLASRQPVGR